MIVRGDSDNGRVFAMPTGCGYVLRAVDGSLLFVAVGFGDGVAQASEHLGVNAEHEHRHIVILAIGLVLEEGPAFDLMCEAGLDLIKTGKAGSLVLVRPIKVRDLKGEQEHVERELRAALGKPVGKLVRAHQSVSGRWSMVTCDGTQHSEAA